MSEPSSTSATPAHPTWTTVIADLFAAPYWIATSKRSDIAMEWNGCMAGYLVYLDRYESVREWAVTIYNHLHSRNMPLTNDKTQLWPDDALEQLRLWINEGCRKDDSEPIHYRDVIPSFKPRPAPVRVRKNIVHMTEAELAEYRMKLEDIGITRADADSPWQKLAYVHTNWCLHYQEAFLFWHRANMLYLEALLDFPIPYWNWMSPHIAEDGHPEAGLPQAFRDETYIHPKTGEKRPNPLRYAVAKDGKSKACAEPTARESNASAATLGPAAGTATPGTAGGTATKGSGAGTAPAGIDCRYVQRDPLLYTSGDDHRAERQEKLNQLLTYQDQVRNAFAWTVFSTAQGSPGYPWANIQTFPAPDSAYPHKCDFDGLYEQPHDNYHGWLGPDMADNAYTAFDPVFWSHHAMIDYVLELWLRDHPAAMYTASCPLQPFVGTRAEAIDEADPRAFVYTTIGDLAKDSRSLGFDFEPLLGNLAIATSFAPSEQLFVRFDGVRCTHDTYAIDVFLNEANPTPEKAKSDNPHFVMRMMRIGMGIRDDKGRCIAQGVTRVIDASKCARALGLAPQSPVFVGLVVTDVTTKRVLSPDEIAKLPGFSPQAVWSNAPATPAVESAAPPGTGHSCCH